jgi:hypothetical protein
MGVIPDPEPVWEDMWADEQGRETLLKAAKWDAEREEMQKQAIIASQDLCGIR